MRRTAEEGHRRGNAKQAAEHKALPKCRNLPRAESLGSTTGKQGVPRELPQHLQLPAGYVREASVEKVGSGMIVDGPFI